MKLNENNTLSLNIPIDSILEKLEDYQMITTKTEVGYETKFEKIKQRKEPTIIDIFMFIIFMLFIILKFIDSIKNIGRYAI